MWYLIFVNALFIPIGLVSSRLVPHSLYPRQAVNPHPLQYCRIQVELGGCPYPCVDGECPCYEFCTDGEQVCNYQNGGVVFQYCVATDTRPASQIFAKCQQYCTDHCNIIHHDHGVFVPACVKMAKGPLDPNRLLGKVQDAYTNPKTNGNFNIQPIEQSEGTSTSSYSKSLQKSGSGEEDFFYPEDMYRDTLSLEDLGSW